MYSLLITLRFKYHLTIPISRHVIRNEGKYRDQAVVIKRLKKDSIIDTLTLRKEIKEMRDLKHPNVINFIGACLESPNVVILLELAGKVC